MTIIVWTETGGLENKSKVEIPPNVPTSDPYTFRANISEVVCKGQCVASTYFGKKYYINSLLEIISGGNGSSLKIDEYSYSSSLINPNLKICKTDPLYKEFAPSCTDELPNC